MRLLHVPLGAKAGCAALHRPAWLWGVRTCQPTRLPASPIHQNAPWPVILARSPHNPMTTHPCPTPLIPTGPRRPKPAHTHLPLLAPEDQVGVLYAVGRAPAAAQGARPRQRWGSTKGVVRGARAGGHSGHPHGPAVRNCAGAQGVWPRPTNRASREATSKCSWVRLLGREGACRRRWAARGHAATC